MSDETQEDRTFEPTPRKRERARQAGDVARSPLLAGALGWFVGLAVLRTSAPHWSARWSELASDAWRGAGRVGVDPTTLASDLQRWLFAGLAALLPPCGAIAAGIVAAHVLQAGWTWLPDRIAPSADRLAGGAAWRRFGDGETWRSALRDTLQLAAGLAVVAWRAAIAWREFGANPGRSASDVATALFGFALDAALWAAGAWLVVALADFAWIWRARELRLHMTPEEARQEAKEETRARAPRRLRHGGLGAED